MSSAVTKKFINSPENAVDDALNGLVNSSQHITYHTSCRRVTLRTDYEDYCAKGRVALIAGGGSGHEPYAAGYIGPGMLTAAVSGNVFASPPSRHVSAALDSTATQGGSILFIINYTGDRLNFGLAAQRFKAAGNDVRVVTIADDVAIDSAMSTAGRRGLVAAVLVLKVAGAMAESGEHTAEQIEEMANRVNDNSGTMGVSMYPCSVPGHGKMFEMPNDMIEVGLGIHGEPGCRREAIRNAHEIVDMILSKLQSTVQFDAGDLLHIISSKQFPRRSRCSCCESSRNYAGMVKVSTRLENIRLRDQEIVLLINNLGGVSQLEMSIIKGEAIKWCNAPTQAPGWRAAEQIGEPEEAPSADESQIGQAETETKGVEFTTEQAELAKKVVRAVCEKMEASEAELNALDGAAGDGDCGSTFVQASKAIKERMKSLEVKSAQQLLSCLSEVFEQEVGGTGGALYALMLSAASEAFETSVESEDFVTALNRASEAVQKYGGAKPGDRTLVDALHAAAEKAKSDGDNWDAILEAATKAAQSTAQMKARAGRASYTAKEVGSS
ncbi:unnamed protein product [Heligmosomoides polygyrus]|uniref:Triokinase/FMN cyclase n=1 Tax=Heligmosomoides polygyrus TaxID=6339 RepID=A0A3P8AVD4_HELPZ|nr:unnamed protein product [Heligmosomoides polygyrus]